MQFAGFQNVMQRHHFPRQDIRKDIDAASAATLTEARALGGQPLYVLIYVLDPAHTR
jgi:hypothetical protein